MSIIFDVFVCISKNNKEYKVNKIKKITLYIDFLCYIISYQNDRSNYLLDENSSAPINERIKVESSSRMSCTMIFSWFNREKRRLTKRGSKSKWTADNFGRASDVITDANEGWYVMTRRDHLTLLIVSNPTINWSSCTGNWYKFTYSLGHKAPENPTTWRFFATHSDRNFNSRQK